MGNSQILTAQEQIEYLRDCKNVVFDLVDETGAQMFLEDRNYFFKLKAFAKNFDKRFAEGEDKGKYINLDFGHLVELSRLDKQLRDLVLQLTLDIEHCLKTRINKAAMAQQVDSCDLTARYLSMSRRNVIADQAVNMKREHAGLLISQARDILEKAIKRDDMEGLAQGVNEAVACLDEARIHRNPDYIADSLSRMKDSPYSKDLVQKYEGRPLPYWCFLELVSFGTTISFYNASFRKDGLLASDKLETVVQKRTRNLLRRAQSLRNAAAHNDCLLNRLSCHGKSKSSAGVKKMLLDGYSVEEDKFYPVSNVLIAIDLAAVLMCYDEFVPFGETRAAMAKRLRSMAGRFALHRDWFKKTEPVDKFIVFVEHLFSCFAGIFERGGKSTEADR